MTDLAQLKTTVLLATPENAGPEQYVTLLGQVENAKRFLKELESTLDQQLIEYIDTHGPFTVGDIRYVVTVDKSYKPRMPAAQMAQACIEMAGGDWDRFASFLSSGAIKYGAVKSALKEAGTPERFDEFFEAVERRSVDGKPVRTVKALDTKYI